MSDNSSRDESAMANADIPPSSVDGRAVTESEHAGAAYTDALRQFLSDGMEPSSDRLRSLLLDASTRSARRSPVLSAIVELHDLGIATTPPERWPHLRIQAAAGETFDPDGYSGALYAWTVALDLPLPSDSESTTLDQARVATAASRQRSRWLAVGAALLVAAGLATWIYSATTDQSSTRFAAAPGDCFGEVDSPKELTTAQATDCNISHVFEYIGEVNFIGRSAEQNCATAVELSAPGAKPVLVSINECFAELPDSRTERVAEFSQIDSVTVGSCVASTPNFYGTAVVTADCDDAGAPFRLVSIRTAETRDDLSAVMDACFSEVDWQIVFSEGQEDEEVYPTDVYCFSGESGR